MDIEKCYDSVEAKKLSELLRSTALLDREYYVVGCITLRRRNNVLAETKASTKEPIKMHFRHKFHKLCVEGGEYPALMEVVGTENDFNLKRSLLVEHEARKKLSKRDALTPLDYIIQNNYITFNKKQFK